MRVNEYINQQTLDTFKKQLSTKGYTSIGAGVDAMVFAKKTGDVIKVLIGERDRKTDVAAGGFLAFAKFCKRIKSPHLPRFSKIVKTAIGTEEVYQVSVERLYDLTEDERDVVWQMAQSAEDDQSFVDVVNNIKAIGSDVLPPYKKDQLRIRNTQLQVAEKNKSIFPLIKKLVQYAGSVPDLSLDLINDSGRNVMKRRDGTWVITDPFVL